MARRRPLWMIVGCAALWVVLLALLPWWLGLPALLAPAAAVLLLQQRLSAPHAGLIRQALEAGDAFLQQLFSSAADNRRRADPDLRPAGSRPSDPSPKGGIR